MNVKEKRSTKSDFNEELNEIQLGDAGYQMRNALACALCDVTWSALTREEKITATETIIQQFSDAYMAYYPAYLDMLAEQYGEMEMWNAKRFETKEGRKISASTKETMKSACDQIKGAHEMLTALLADEADGEDTTAKAAGTAITPKAEAALKPEPVVIDHSAALNLIRDIRSLIPA